MNQFLTRISIMLLLMGLAITLKSQDYVRFGQIDPSYYTMDKCPFDSAAPAFFIFNEQTCITGYYKTNLTYVNGILSNQPEYHNIIHIHRAIKILDNSATDWGSYVIDLYPKSQKLSYYKGFTYNMEGNKLVKSKLEKSQVIFEDISPTRQRVKFSMPQVKKGSVIEYEIGIASENFYSLGPYPLQFTIPVEKNILIVKTMESYHYNKIVKGYNSLSPAYSTNTITVPINVVEEEFAGRTRSQRNITYKEITEEYYMNNVPAFPMESYLTTPENYISSIRFELAYTKFSNSAEKHFNTSWEALAKTLLDEDDFGQQLKNTGFLSDLANDLKAKSSDQASLAQACYEAIRDKITCNNMFGILCDKNIRDVYKNGEGDVPGINMLLTALLREAGLKAWPVILSTRANGMIQPIYPSIEDFNYLICMAEVDGKRVLMDATDKYLTMNLLKPYCLNDKGRIIDQTETGWVELTNTDNLYKRTATWDVEFNEDGVALAKVTETYDNIAGYLQRDDIREEGGFAKYIENINHPDNGFTVTASEVENIEQLDQPLIQKLDLELNKDYLQGDLYIFLPLFTEVTSENPFKLKKREYPVEFDYPMNDKVVIRIKIPDGYKVESVPPNKTCILPGNAASYGFKVTKGENEIVAEYNFQMNKMRFIENQYEDLKEFFRLMVESQHENVVFVKSSI